jgi:PPM family protein phosphatase
MICVESAGLTDVGMKRKGNEDAFFLDDDLRLYVVADGMGGHQAGEVASDLVVKTIRDYMKRFGNGEEVEELEDSDKTLSKAANRIMSGIVLSNRVVHQAARSRMAYQGMGSTVAAVYFAEDTMIAVNVGDSPIFLVRGERFETLSVPHTVLAEQAALNRDGDDRFGKEYGHMLTRAMGIDDTVRADICELQCFKGDTLVIASDGLSNKVSAEEIREIVAAKRPARACRILVDLANERGGDDNITVIVLRVKNVRRKGRGPFARIARLFGAGA